MIKKLIVGFILLCALIAPVLAAETEIFLDTPTSTYTCSEGGYAHPAFIKASAYGAGTGKWNPFLTTSTPKSPKVTEEGINNDPVSDQWETDWQGGKTKSIQVKDVPQEDVGGVMYGRFDLDVNEAGDGLDRFIGLGMVRIYVGDAGAGLYDPAAGTFADGTPTLVWDLDEACGADGAFVTIDYKLEAGSGWSDMTLYVPHSVVDAMSDEDYVYFYTRFGDPATNGTASLTTNDGFEEWRLVEGITPPPPPTLNLYKVVDSGTLLPADWDLTASDGVNGFTDTGDSTTFHDVTAGVWYTLSESDNPDYITNGIWECDDGTMLGDDMIMLTSGQSASCHIHNRYTPNVPEFPSLAVPVGLIIGFIGIVFTFGKKK
jgi:hypothetical protein